MTLIDNNTEVEDTAIQTRTLKEFQELMLSWQETQDLLKKKINLNNAQFAWKTSNRGMGKMLLS
jgi:hypothetical protein